LIHLNQVQPAVLRDRRGSKVGALSFFIGAIQIHNSGIFLNPALVFPSRWQYAALSHLRQKVANTILRPAYPAYPAKFLLFAHEQAKATYFAGNSEAEYSPN